MWGSNAVAQNSWTPSQSGGREFEPSPPAKHCVPTIANSPQRSNTSPLDADHVLELFSQIQSKTAAERESSYRRSDQVPTEIFRTFKQRILFVCGHMDTIMLQKEYQRMERRI